MESLTKPCPQCQAQPEVSPQAGQIVLICPQHGHMAIGDDLEAAIYHWNIYVTFVGKAA